MDIAPVALDTAVHRWICNAVCLRRPNQQDFERFCLDAARGTSPYHLQKSVWLWSKCDAGTLGDQDFLQRPWSASQMDSLCGNSQSTEEQNYMDNSQLCPKSFQSGKAISELLMSARYGCRGGGGY